MKKWEKPIIQELELKNTAEATYQCKECFMKYKGNWSGAVSVGAPNKEYYVTHEGTCGANPNHHGGVNDNNMCRGELVQIEVSGS